MEGVPIGAEIVAVRCVAPGEWYISSRGCVYRRADTATFDVFPVIRWTHSYGDRPLEAVPIPADTRLAGGTIAGAFRPAVIGDLILTPDGDVSVADRWTGHWPRLILERAPEQPKPPKRRAVKVYLQDGTIQRWLISGPQPDYAEVVEVPDEA